ncbi:sensor histidine kinase [Halanaeroarchaeum sulfurireducens]|uniref:PAS/PAC sensor signal transduction histidine kinase n=1 Tax=Halanaeroarchaeum sulfurireducens TaxID=1604004 RepID=A0A0F7P6A0_9EURY|nr:PAS domain-containing sensor histidine kinase [Halanaeroarchaeum sulfurireducens]AKH96666.1 PAS/PAC sensor signal transduction histidine kinase [Halanaeroarchaeum sulfurireducens]
MIPQSAWNGLDALADSWPWLPFTGVLGAATLTTLSVMQKLQQGAPVTNPDGYVVPVLFGAVAGLGFGYGYRKRARHLESLQEEVASRREKERRLQRYRLAVEGSTNLLTALDREYSILFANPEYRAFHGIPPEEDCSDCTLPEVIGDRAFAEVKPYVDRAFEGDSCEFEVTREGVDGTEREFVIRNFPLVDDGEITGIVAAMTDVTERRERRRELITQKQRYQSLFESIRDAIVVSDTDGRIVNTNPAFTELFGYEFSEVEGAGTAIIYDDDSGFDAAEALNDRSSPDIQSRTNRYRKRSGQVFEGEESLYPVRNPDDQVTGYVAIIRDVSNRETRLQQLQVLERVLRHNINNDMNVIAGYAETIRDDASGPMADYAETILTKSEALVDTADKEREITSHLLRTPTPERRDLRSTILQTVESARERYPGADITTDLPDPCVSTATDAIGQALEELIENAIVHSDRDAPSVRVTVERREDVLEMIIADDGPGIPEMERSVLTGDADIEPLYHGSGLGLWLVNLIVRQSNGVLRFEENDPRGSIVTISLPRTPAGSAQQRPPDPADDSLTSDSRTRPASR